MMTDCDLVSLRVGVRDHIGEATAKLWHQDRVDRAINDEYSKLVRTVITADEGHFTTKKTYAITTQTYVDLPRWATKIRNIEVYRDSKWHPIDPIGVHLLYKYQRPDDSQLEAMGVRFEGNTLQIEPGSSNITQLRIFYDRVPAPLRYEQAQAGAATTITLGSGASIYDDIYIGDEIVTLAGTGLGQNNVITDYVGSTKVATVSTWGTNPDSSTYFSIILAHPISQFPELLQLGAAKRLLLRRRDTEMINAIQAQYNDEFQRFKDFLEPRQTDRPRYINYVQEDLEDF